MEELYLDAGARVHFRDGKGGTLHKTVVEPHSHRVTHLVILKGFLQPHDYVIPVSCVEKATAQDITLTLTTAELENYPEYREVEFREWRDDWGAEMKHPRAHVVTWMAPVGVFEPDRAVLPVIRRRMLKGIPPREKVIGRDSVVRTLDDIVGRVDHLWLHRDTWELTHMVVRHGVIPHYIIVPVSWITSIEPDEIYILSSAEPLPQLTADELSAAMASVLGPDVNGDAYPLDHNLAIAADLTEALAADARTAESVIEVVFEGGVATLGGTVESEVVHRAAEAIAAADSRVVSVVNALEVRPSAAGQDILQTAEGGMMRLIEPED